MLLDYFWRTGWERDDYKLRAKSLAEAIWEYSKTFTPNSVEFSELLPIAIRLFALAGDVETARKIRYDLLGEITEAAIDHYNRRAYDIAEKFIDIVLEGDPKNWRMRLYKARIKVRREKWGDAESIIKALLEERPNDKRVLHVLGWRYLRAKEYEKALAQFSKVIALGNHLMSLRDAAECLHALGRDDEALKFLSTAKSMESEDAYILDLEAKIYEKREEYGLAYESAKGAVMRNPVDSLLRHRLGRILMALKRVGEAVPCFEKAIELNPTQFPARASLVDAMLDLRSDIKAIKAQLADAKRFSRTGNEEAVIVNLDARCLRVEGHTEKAITLLADGIMKKEVCTIRNLCLFVDLALSQYYKEKDSYPSSAKVNLGRAKQVIEQGLVQYPDNKELIDLKSRNNHLFS